MTGVVLPPRIRALIDDARRAGYVVSIDGPDEEGIVVHIDIDETGDIYSLYWRLRNGRWRLFHSTDRWTEDIPLAEVRFRLSLDGPKKETG